jgi:uncharacterized protein (DUF362 family)
MKRPITRREFLASLAAGMGVVALSQWLGGCTPATIPPSEQVLEPTRTKASPPTSAPTQEQAAQPTEANLRSIETISPTEQTAVTVSEPTSEPAIESGTPYLVVSHGTDPESMLTKALAALGGIERFVSQGDQVIIKPNICVAYHSYEYAATTNPWLVGAMVKLCIGAGAKSVKVMDSPFGGTPAQAYAISGIEEQVKASGGEMVEMANFKFINTPIPNGKAIQKWPVYDEVLKADVLINMPIAKHHSLARLTLGMKNLLGVIQNRSQMHANMGEKLADLTSLVQPTLTIVDAIRILMANGPTGGNLKDVKQTDMIIVSPDIVAADSYATGLFGLKPDDIAYIKAGTARGLGRSDLDNLEIEEITDAG